MLKYKYIFQIKCTEAISSNSTRKLLWFEIAKLLIAVRKNYCVICNNFRHTFVPYAISKGLTRVWTGVLVQLKIAAVFYKKLRSINKMAIYDFIQAVHKTGMRQNTRVAISSAKSVGAKDGFHHFRL